MSTEPALSILIPTLSSRKGKLERLQRQLRVQVEASRELGEVEVLVLADDGARSIGSKRNELIDRARGRYVVFVDDDDRVSDDYIARVLQALRSRPDLDCVCIRGEVRFRGGRAAQFRHSTRFPKWERRDGQYRRPPSHLCPMRRRVARSFRFENVNACEDIDWSMRIHAAGALKREIELEGILYYYDSRRHGWWQELIDRTQTLRQWLGIERVQRVRWLRRWKRGD